jgi:hypothetical protein
VNAWSNVVNAWSNVVNAWGDLVNAVDEPVNAVYELRKGTLRSNCVHPVEEPRSEPCDRTL